ncbi:CDR ABC transporter [Penicillium coprophilum]|uniref:CDR ABC transporter n=1 Tax=Penicillium coprophilum TaxID=36646 RepID=UPI002386A858|nr:CDR ABC transporter [Penicillium coprophilum]KAJ5164263.1 CDR ABC transporter [Penicillium coprophilum]
MKEETEPRETPEGSTAGDESKASLAAKDRKCQYCQQAFTSSSLGRHLDQFLFKKKPDGIHDVEEIRRIRSGITRRQARTSTGKNEGSPERGQKKGASEPFTAADPGSKSREAPVRMMFNTPTWHATGVINDIPNPSRVPDGPRIAPSQSRTGSLQLPDYASRGATSSNPDTMRALELALREVLDNIKAASSRTRPRLSPFDFDMQAQTFPSMCLQLLPPPPSLFATHPFPSSTSFPLQPPGVEHLDIIRQALRSKVAQWQTDQLAADSTGAAHTRHGNSGVDPNMIYRSAQQHEDISFRHLELAFNHWNSLPHETRREAWQLEITRAFAREVERRKSSDEQLVRVQQEANQLRAQVERLGSCQWPHSHISADSTRWDYDSVVAKWKRVVMHDKGMGRIGVGYGNPPQLGDPEQSQSQQSPDVRPPRPGEDTTSHPNRLRPLQSATALSPEAAAVSTPASSNHYASPHSYADSRSPPSSFPSGLAQAGALPPAKRQRLMNGSEDPSGPSSESSHAPAAAGKPWGSSTPHLSNLAAPSGQTPPSSRN